MPSNDLKALKYLYNAFDPLKPAEPDQYVDSDLARGSRDLTKQFSAELARIEDGFLCFVFSGHVGCGKSSELRHLADRLREGTGSALDAAYLPIVLNAEDFIDANDVSTTDILLAIVAHAGHRLSEEGIDLADSFLTGRMKEVRDVLFGNVELTELSLFEKSAKIQVLKSDPNTRDKVRKALEDFTTPLREEIAILFEDARTKLRKRKESKGKPKYKDIVLILDNLEKIQHIEGYDHGYKSQRELFIERASQLTGLGVHVVYTVPLTLAIRDGPELAQRYGSEPFVLPMVKVAERNHDVYQAGYKTLRELVEKRIGSGRKLDDVFDADALDFLIQYSGGNARQLVRYIRETTLCDKLPIDIKEAHTAIRETINSYGNMPSTRFWGKLAALECSPDHKPDMDDEDVKVMLEQLRILEYRNGDDEDDVFGSSDSWYAVHPIIRELNTFKNAVEALKKAEAKANDL